MSPTATLSACVASACPPVLVLLPSRPLPRTAVSAHRYLEGFENAAHASTPPAEQSGQSSSERPSLPDTPEPPRSTSVRAPNREEALEEIAAVRLMACGARWRGRGVEEGPRAGRGRAAGEGGVGMHCLDRMGMEERWLTLSSALVALADFTRLSADSDDPLLSLAALSKRSLRPAFPARWALSPEDTPGSTLELDGRDRKSVV